MSDDRSREEGTAEESADLTPEQLRGWQWGVAATVMPTQAGWRVRYFSVPDFDREEGTDFPTFEAALGAIADILPSANSDASRQRASAELRRRIQASSSGDGDVGKM